MRTAAERVQYINERKQDAGRPERLWILDAWSDFQIVKVPVDGLVINADNRRFRAERMWAESQLGRSLDPENLPQDERTIESLLLDTSHRLEGDHLVGTPTTDALAPRTDWERRRQESPFWIRPDGTVRNGNRRLAMIKRAQREAGDTGLQWVEAVILDETDVDEPALLEMEQREQLTENFKVRYNDIDYLLALKEAAELREVDWFSAASIDDVAGGLQSMVEKSKGEVVRDLYAIKYMDLFLEDSEQPGEYHRLLRNLERFRDIARTMMKVEEDYPLDLDQVLQVMFAAVRAGTPHLEIRQIRRMLLTDRERFDSLSEQVSDIEEDWTPTVGSLETPELSDLDSDDDDAIDGDEPGPEVRNYPKTEVSTAIQLAIDSFAASQGASVGRTLKEIINRLAVLDQGDKLRESISDADGPALRVDLAVIVDWADRHRDLLPSE